MHNRTKLLILSAITLVSIIFYLGWGLGVGWQFAVNLRLKTVAAILVAGVAVGISTLVFHCIVNNRVVTPQALGLDKLYELSKTLIIYFFGASTLLSMNFVMDYVISLGLMLGFALLLYRFIFKKVAEQNIYFLLLVGLICATLFDSMATFLQVLLDPDEFQIAAYAGFASFNIVKIEIVILALITVVPILIYALKNHNQLDVMALGREHALNLGLDYDKTSRTLLILVVLALASATALAGPMMFLGLLVLNITLELFKTHRHHILLVGIILVSILSLIVGQFVVLHILNNKTTLSVIINFVGGVYFFWILLKENKKWQLS
ncbi:MULTISPECIES: iron chelate uptake ABC transporter family permease subunit [unclassified Acinetobacter]|uniref:iron chelate uptake ABC transporter family permease subunit n=1 Tax=unclassified Acinetobacter TaxID=196816 RepID=UPI00190A09AD|nr:MULTISPECIES: iron chelate uptake ABC transporter family permease subunit [unclassified Acinetobacter]MBK0063390.1 iron chelate uptake ABC transporter family permease subunit [Acinetobacter sp. S55]MBK0066698.1 iron chelate uptake ABC transporter family permease subunit [Acinetobacter sp. S54]